MVVILHIFIYLCTFSFINHIFIASNTLPPLLSQPEKHLRHPLLLASLPLLQMKMHMPLWNARWGLQGSLKTPLHPGWGTQGFLQHEDTMQMLTDCLQLGFLKLLYFLLIQDGVFVRRMNQNNSCMFLMRSLFRYISRVPRYISSTVCCWYRSLSIYFLDTSTIFDTTRHNSTSTLRETRNWACSCSEQNSKAKPNRVVTPERMASRHRSKGTRLQKSKHKKLSYWFRIKTLRIQGYFKVTSVTYYCIL